MADKSADSAGAKRDPGSAVPPGVAPEEPPPLGKQEMRAKRSLEQMAGEPAKAGPEAGGTGEPQGPEKRGA